MNHLTDPRYGNIHLDANALDEPDPQRATLVSEFKRYAEAFELSLVEPQGVRVEIAHPNTPSATRQNMPGVYTKPTNLTPDEASLRLSLEQLMVGGARPGKHEADAHHLFEACKYGGRYFITHDQRLLGKRSQIARICPGLAVVDLPEFVQICRSVFGPLPS